jgi:hypothetical protein
LGLDLFLSGIYLFPALQNIYSMGANSEIVKGIKTQHAQWTLNKIEKTFNGTFAG